MNTPSPRPYAAVIPLRWADMDAYGHVNNVQFLRLLEQSRIVAFQDWFQGQFDVLASGVMVARQEIEYLAPLNYRPEPVHVVMWVSRIARSSFDLAYEVCDPPQVGDQVYARAETTMVAYDFTQERPRPLQQPEREVFSGLLGDPVPMRRR